MNEKTAELLQALEQADWLSAVGKPPPEMGVSVATDSTIAAQLLSRGDWEDFRMHRSNEITRFLWTHHREQYGGHWNLRVREVKAVLSPMVDRKLEAHPLGSFDPGRLKNCVRSDLVNACMEREYLDLTPFRFYTYLAGWYLLGHLPCGWDGIYPDGNLIIY